MKRTLIIVFFTTVFCKAFSQKNTFTIGSLVPLTGVVGIYEHRLPVVNKRIGIGVIALYRNPPSIDAKELSIGPRFNYFIVDRKAGGLYIGTGLGGGTLNEEEKWRFRLQAGINAKILKSFSFKLEYSNFMLEDNGVGILGGLQYTF